MIDRLYDINAASKWWQICFITEAFIEPIHSKQLIHLDQARMGHWITEPIL